MPRKGGVPENLKPQNKRSEKERREIGRKGGIASGKKRRERIAISEMYKEYLAGASNSDEIVKAIQKIIKRANKDSVSMMKELREATEGKVIKPSEGGLEAFASIMQALAPEKNDSE